MIVQVSREYNSLEIRWWPDGEPWSTWSVYKTTDPDTRTVRPAHILGTAPSHMTAETAQEQIEKIQTARDIARALDAQYTRWQDFKATEVIEAPWTQTHPAYIQPKRGCNGWTQIVIPSKEKQ